jgi:hypothetical protein
LRIEYRTPDETEGQHALDQQLFPQVERKVGIGTAQSGDEVIGVKLDRVVNWPVSMASHNIETYGNNRLA